MDDPLPLQSYAMYYTTSWSPRRCFFSPFHLVILTLFVGLLAILSIVPVQISQLLKLSLPTQVLLDKPLTMHAPGTTHWRAPGMRNAELPPETPHADHLVGTPPSLSLSNGPRPIILTISFAVFLVASGLSVVASQGLSFRRKVRSYNPILQPLRAINEDHPLKYLNGHHLLNMKTQTILPETESMKDFSDPTIGTTEAFPYIPEDDEVEELEILPVAEEEYSDEAFIVDYHQGREAPPLLRSIRSRHACEALSVLPADRQMLRWVNVTGNQHSLTLPLLNSFRVHPLFVEDILHDAERAKVENLGADELIVLFQAVQLVEEKDPEDLLPLLRLEMNQVSLVLQDRVLLSFFNFPSKTVEQVKAALAISSNRLRTSSSHWLVHMIMDKEVDRLFPIMNRFRMQLEEVQQLLESKRPHGMLANPNSNSARILQVLQTTSQEMNNLLFVLRPLASTVAALTEYCKQRGMRELQWHFEDLRDHIATILDYVASMQTWVKCLKDDYSYIQQENMNRTMYTLTLITALFVPAQFLTGLFGMNFQYMPWLNWEYGFWAFWGVIFGVSSFSILVIKRIRWL